MRVEVILFLVMFITIEGLNAQNIEVMLIPFEVDGKWGYVNNRDSIIVKPIYEEAYPTYEFRGRVKNKGKYGYIDEKGSILIEAKYDTAKDFNYGIAEVSNNGKFKTINVNGGKIKNEVVLCGNIYDDCLKQQSLLGVDTIKMGDKFLITIKKEKRIHGRTNYFLDTLNTLVDNVTSLGDQYVVIEKGEKKAILFDAFSYPSSYSFDDELEFKYSNFKLFPCQEGISISKIIAFQKDEKWGIIQLGNKQRQLIREKYLSINSLREGLVLVEYQKGSYGYVSLNGREYFNRKEYYRQH